MAEERGGGLVRQLATLPGMSYLDAHWLHELVCIAQAPFRLSTSSSYLGDSPELFRSQLSPALQDCSPHRDGFRVVHRG